MQRAFPDHRTGTVLEGRYELGPRIARGGTATVYRAVDTRLQRVVAVKLMHAHLAEDPAAADRFVREARAAARLSHPHVVSVLDQGHAPDGVPYLVMEHVAGSTLRDRVRGRGPLSPRDALALLEPVLDGLAAAHREGLVHRDVKPENVLIADTGRVTVADFGLTRAVDQHTATGTVLGTVGYASPELVTGRRVDTRADVYSAGIVLFELLAGRRPFAGGPLAVARAHAEDGVPDLRSLDPGVPDALARLVARATARDPQGRPADAGAFLEELRAAREVLRPAELDRVPPAGPVRGPGPAPTRLVPAGPPSAGSPSAPSTPGDSTEALHPAAAPTEDLRPPQAPGGAPGPAPAPAEERRAQAAPTEVLRSPGAAADAAAAPRATPSSGGSSDPWRPEIELRPSRPLRAAGMLALVALAVAAAAFLGWLLGTGTAVPDDASAGAVVGQHPGPGTDVPVGPAVDPAVSGGPSAENAPGVPGRPVGGAVRDLAEAGLPARVEEGFGAPSGHAVARTTDGAEVALTVL
ncbi:protein kinase domain-containing protein [Kocuria kalidii]|uniref:protein kinase domain-containing protein n=1 Tax=Kocuria kalidii TaxID=3376283 RepID=UPI0037B907BF